MNLFEMFDEQKELTLIDALRDFLPIAVNHLHIKTLPKISLSRNVETEQLSSFGKFDGQESTIQVSVENRHPNDILRTLAHELTHYAQNEGNELDSSSWETGSAAENDANAIAGVIMRKFNSKYPHYITLNPVILP